MPYNVLHLHAVAEALACAVGAIECRCCYRQYGLLNEKLTLKKINKNAKENFKRMGKVRLRFG